MKYRIRKESNCEGEAYYPQYKKFLFWHYFKRMVGVDVYNIIGYKHLDDAINFIDNNKKDRDWKKECRKSFKKEIIAVSSD